MAPPEAGEASPTAGEWVAAVAVWQVEDAGGWHFVTLPEDWNDDFQVARTPGPGFGSVRVRVRIADLSWDTSVFPDKRRGAYVLPMKRTVRERLGITAGDTVEVRVTLVG